MDSINIQTSQNVSIEQPLASVAERMLSFIIDAFFMGVYLLFFLIVLDINIEYDKVLLIIVFLPITFYHLLFEMYMNGQSFGKKIMKIKVMQEDGTSPSAGSYFVRWVFRLVDITIMAGGLATVFIMFSKKYQRLGDMAAKTVVVRLNQKSYKKSIYTILPNNYQLVYPEVNKLSDSDMRVLKEVLDFMKQENYMGNSLNMGVKARKAIEEKMGIKSELNHVKFLQTVLKDYNYIKIG